MDYLSMGVTMCSNKMLIKFLFIFPLISFEFSCSANTKISDYIYEDENGSILIYEKPIFCKSTFSIGKKALIGGTCAIVGGITFKNAPLVVLGLVSGFTGFILSLDSLVKQIKKKIWGHMIALGKKGIYDWNNGFLQWKDVEDISLEEKTVYSFAGTNYNPRFGRHKSDFDFINGNIKPKTISQIRLKIKDKSDGSGNSSWLKSKLKNPDFVVNLRNISLDRNTLLELVKKFWNENKSQT